MMSSVEGLREFVNERLSVAAEEIFRVFKNKIAEYEEEIARQRKIIDVVCKPQLKLQRLGLDEILAEQQLYIQENCSLDQDERETLQIKEEPEEMGLREEGQTSPLKQETDIFMLNSSYEENDISDPGAENDFNNSPDAENQDPDGDQHEEPGTVTDAKSEPRKEQGKSNHYCSDAYQCKMTAFHAFSDTRKTSFKCDTCGKVFKYGSSFRRHLNVHTGERMYVCKVCGKVFNDRSNMSRHIRSHTINESYSIQHMEKISDFVGTS